MGTSKKKSNDAVNPLKSKNHNWQIPQKCYRMITLKALMVHSKKPTVSEFHTVAVSLNAMNQVCTWSSVGDNGVCPLRRDLSAYGN